MGCTKLLVSYPATCMAPPYAIRSTLEAQCKAGTNGFEALFQVYRVGAKYAGDVYAGTPSSCSKVKIDPMYNVWAVSDEIPPSTFVEGSQTVQ